MKIFELSEKPELIREAIEYFWNCWGNENNFEFYEDCIMNSLTNKNKLPKFFIGVEDEKIVCSFALLTNDLISRQDLYPWFACLYVNESNRKRGYAGMLLDHGLEKCNELGFGDLYLSTDLENFYEKKGWSKFGEGYGFNGDKTKIYQKK